MKKIRVRLGIRSYDILIGHGIISQCGRIITGLSVGNDAIVVTNKRVFGLFGNQLKIALTDYGISAHFEIVADSEKAKSQKTASGLIGRISAYDKGKRVFVVALGGGVTGDLAGFVASVYKRGTPYIQLPTTLLAQVDSSIGGKVAVDLPEAKNLVGSFYQPRVVISDISVLNKLPARQIRSGLAEVIKYGVIKDRKLFEFMESSYEKILALDSRAIEHIVSVSSGIKAALVSLDELDKKGVRSALNFGHTIGHAIETASEYSGRYNHGEAVAIGMVASARMSLRLKILDISAAGRIEALIKKVGLPTRIRGLDLKRIYASHLHDKKFIGSSNRFILARAIGSVKVAEDLPAPLIKSVLKEISE
jgi:3-dehydroquinate synthase